MEVENEVSPTAENDVIGDLEVTETEGAAAEAGATENVIEADPKAGEEPPPGKTEAEEAGEIEAGGEGEEAVVDPKAFKPNTKYTVMDKEAEIPKEFHGLMKDAASEKMVREIFEKAGGLEPVKAKLADTRIERDKYLGEARSIQTSINTLRGIYQGAKTTGQWLKLDDFFTKLQIPHDDVLQYALAKVKHAELPPDQRQLVDSRLESDRQAEALRIQSQNLQDSAAQSARTVKATQTDLVLARADIKPVADAFDARMKKSGAFREALNRHGEYMWNKGTDLTPDQAALEVIRMYGLTAAPVTPPANQQVNPAVNAGQPSNKKVIQRNSNTIPNVRGNAGASPLKAKPKSIDDLRTLYKQRLTEGA